MFISTRKNPRGPIGKWNTFSFDFSGSTLQLTCPQPNRVMWSEENNETSRKLNLYDADNFGRQTESDESEPLLTTQLIRRWDFDGIPFWDSKPIGHFQLEVSIAMMPDFSNLFRPRRLECAIERFIYASSKSRQISGISRDNWQQHKINQIEWAHYDFPNNPGFYNAEEASSSIWNTAISDRHLLTISFKKIYKVKKSGLAPLYQDMIEKIMHSLTIDFSEDAKASRAEAAQYSWEKLPEDLPPYEFEEVEQLSIWDINRALSAKLNHDTSIPFEEFDKMAQKEDKKQKAEAKAARKRVLASHLRFEELEAEDKKRYEQSKQIIKN